MRITEENKKFLQTGFNNNLSSGLETLVRWFNSSDLPWWTVTKA